MKLHSNYIEIIVNGDDVITQEEIEKAGWAMQEFGVGLDYKIQKWPILISGWYVEIIIGLTSAAAYDTIKAAVFASWDLLTKLIKGGEGGIDLKVKRLDTGAESRINTEDGSEDELRADIVRALENMRDGKSSRG